MRKLLTSCLCAALTFAASNALAINNGSWDLNSGVQNGLWAEVFVGGGPGQPGNLLVANSSQWFLGGLTLDNASGSAGVYTTIYKNGLIDLNNGPWGTGSTFSPITAVNESSSVNGLRFEITMTGANTAGQNIEVVATFAATGQNYSPIIQDGVTIGHQGSGFDRLRVTISSVPDTGSTLALLCPALVGLAAWRRKH